MSDPAGTFNDGGVVFGSQVLNILNRQGQATDYIAEEFSLDDPSNWFVRKNQVGVPNGQVGTDDIPTGSVTLQLADDTTKLPKKFSRFTAQEVGGSTVELVIAKVGQAFTAEGETKVSCDLRATLN